MDMKMTEEQLQLQDGHLTDARRVAQRSDVLDRLAVDLHGAAACAVDVDHYVPSHRRPLTV